MMQNIPKEPGAWDDDFSYDYLDRLYGALKRDFVPSQLRDALGAAQEKPRAFIRHDIDVSLERAAQLARKENEWGVRTTYHVMLSSPFYNIRSTSSKVVLEDLLAKGHEVGLHYDVVERGTKDVSSEARERDIAHACEELEDLLGREVKSLSFHLPVQELINGPMQVAGRVSGYGKDLFQWYISDSRARWREGDPLTSLTKPRSQNLQILIHPIWWGAQHQHPELRLRDFLHDVGPRLGRSYADLRQKMWDHIIYYPAPESENVP